MKLQDHFNYYMEKMYGGANISETQRTEIKQAWFGACLVMCAELNRISTLPEEEAAKELQKLQSEVLTVNMLRAAECRAVINKRN